MEKITEAKNSIVNLLPLIIPRLNLKGKSPVESYWHYVSPLFWGWRWKDILEVHRGGFFYEGIQKICEDYQKEGVI